MYKMHLDHCWNEREEYRKHCYGVNIVHIPGTPHILMERGVSFIVDKMTKHTTAVPAIRPTPKCINKQLNLTITGLIVHGAGFFYFSSYDSQSQGVNLTIECIDRCLRVLQSMGYKFAPTFYVHGDNHTAIKTPTLILYLANLVVEKSFSRLLFHSSWWAIATLMLIKSFQFFQG
mmetsp:Transcript_16129/g.19074  ORF Transcript_16129/g.19074 Transcript_16129/m.19074 type:complete len:175 (-) Transcript_16129:749-1273(-)